MSHKGREIRWMSYEDAKKRFDRQEARKNMRKMINQIKSVMIGHAIGDALGVPVEFDSREEIAKNPVTDMRGYGTYPMPAGAWSDDTSMSLAALDAMSKTDWSTFDVLVNFSKWLTGAQYTPTDETYDVGKTCMKSVLRFIDKCYCQDEGFVRPDDFDPCEIGLKGERDNGNGSLMRIHPFVLYAYFNNLDYWMWMACVRTGSSLTHAHDRSLMGCYIYGYCLTELLRNPSMQALKDAIDFAGKDLDYLPEFEHYSRIFDPDFASLTECEIKSSGYVVDTLEAALWCVLTTDNYKDCVLKAVNLGGDTDSIAAVAGGLAGALYGLKGIPKEWMSTLIQREYIEKICEHAAMEWYLQSPTVETRR